MSEDVARAVGAESPDGIRINGKDCRPRPLTIKELTELQRECLSQYRRSFVQAFSENADLLPGDEGKKLIREKLEEAARFDISNLPKRDVYDPRKIKINPSIEKWLVENVEGYEKDEEASKEKQEKTTKRVVASALDEGLLDPKVYEELTGVHLVPSRVGYVNWWITGSFDGQIAMICLAFRGCNVTKDEIFLEIGRNPRVLIDLAREIEHLSAPEVGNG